jgi:hypothetical protein
MYRPYRHRRGVETAAPERLIGRGRRPPATDERPPTTDDHLTNDQLTNDERPATNDQ